MINTIQFGQQWWNTWRERSVNTRIFAAMVTVGGFTVLVKLVAGVKELVIAYGFSPEKLELTRRLYFILLPALLFSGLATVWNAVLNAGEQFALGAVMPVVTSLVTIIFLLRMGDRYGIFVLASATVFGLA